MFEMDMFDLEGIELLNYEKVKRTKSKDPVVLKFTFTEFDLNIEEN